jgi:undecaprenyl-diphosphatase
LSVIEALILGIVQGLTEFLPISSSGHLVLFQKLFGIQSEVLTFDLAVHVATLIAVCAVLWKDILLILKKPFVKLTLLIIVATIPAVLIGLIFGDMLEGLYQSGATLGFEFIFTGLVLFLAEKVRVKNKPLEEMRLFDALFIGTAQGLAILPAVSRSGMTLVGALSRGFNREAALKFSFLISIPAIAGAAVLNIFKMSGSVTAVNSASSLFQSDPGMLPALIVGFIAAGVSGFFAIKFMLKVFIKSSLRAFSIYVFIIGALVLIDQLFFNIFFPSFL